MRGRLPKLLFGYALLVSAGCRTHVGPPPSNPVLVAELVLSTNDGPGRELQLPATFDVGSTSCGVALSEHAVGGDPESDATLAELAGPDRSATLTISCSNDEGSVSQRIGCGFTARRITLDVCGSTSEAERPCSTLRVLCMFDHIQY